MIIISKYHYELYSNVPLVFAHLSGVGAACLQQQQQQQSHTAPASALVQISLVDKLLLAVSHGPRLSRKLVKKRLLSFTSKLQLCLVNYNLLIP